MGVPEEKFLADVMLGSLARWLRILGYDTAYDNRIQDEELVRRCLKEGRVALTRDRRLVKRRALQRVLLIESDELAGQLRQVLAWTARPLSSHPILSRCLECNTLLEPLPRERARDQVPPYVFRTQRRFSRCAACGRIYWGGTHRRHMWRRLRDLLGESHPRPSP